MSIALDTQSPVLSADEATAFMTRMIVNRAVASQSISSLEKLEEEGVSHEVWNQLFDKWQKRNHEISSFIAR